MFTLSYGFAHGAPETIKFRRADAARAKFLSLALSPRLRFAELKADDDSLNISYSNFNN